MAAPFTVVLADGAELAAVELVDRSELDDALTALGLRDDVPVLVVVGGAGGMAADELVALRPVFDDVVAVLEERGGTAVDGGTDAGVMRLLGEARHGAAATFPLVGVVAEGTVRVPGRSHAAHAADVEPGHTHLVLVPGREWGDESVWIAEVATVLAGQAASATLLVNGGEVAYADVEHSRRHRRPVVVLGGSGRCADDLAAAAGGDPSASARAAAIVDVGALSVVPRDSWPQVADEIAARLAPSTRSR